MMGGNPSSSWWRIMGSSPISPQQEEQEATPSLFSSSSSAHPQLVHGGGGSSSSPPSTSFSDDFQELPHSWSQLLLGGLTGEEDKFGGVVGHFQPFKKLEKWEDLMNPITPTRANHDYDHDDDDVKQEQQASQNRSEDQEYHHHQFQSHTTMPVSSPRSCVTSSFSSNNYNSKNNSILDFSNTKALHVPPDHHSSECNSKAGGGVCKKARVLSSSSQPPLKVRKEKLGDRLTALHQLVSPFGKTDTASVLLEAIGYIRFLQGQIETLSIPYLGKDKSSGNMRPHHPVNQEGRIGSLLGGEAQMQMDSEEKVKDLRSRGLCLVPVSCTQQVGSDNGADYWAPAFGSGGGF